MTAIIENIADTITGRTDITVRPLAFAVMGLGTAAKLSGLPVAGLSTQASRLAAGRFFFA
jgi:hypothetical protein